MIYITGDTHADFKRFSTRVFPDQSKMTKDDYVIICGDFGGIWDNLVSSASEKYWLDWLDDKPFTTLFVDGNHSNFDRLKKFPRVSFHGGLAHKINDSIYHLMRGYVFDFDGEKFFAFGGAKSHDIQDGILDVKDYESLRELVRDYNLRTRYGQMLRINHYSWWKDELPSSAEMNRGIENLRKVGFKVDYVITHCLPQSVINTRYPDSTDRITKYFDKLVLDYGLDFKRWHCGHYHFIGNLFGKYDVHYEDIVRIQ